MALLVPFRALRPAASAASRVASVPYDVVSTDEARALAADNPLSFLRVTRSEIDLPDDTDIYADAVYAQAAHNLQALEAGAPLVEDEAPTLYFYRQQMGDHIQTGLAGCFSVDEYERDLIKKHEKTRPDKEDDRTRHIIETRAQTGVVFLTYRAVDAVDAVAARVCAAEPLYDFAAPDGIRHTVWTVPPADVKTLVTLFADIPALYIADGHHRAASAARARAALRERDQPSAEADVFICVAFPDRQLQILPYHRIVKDLNGLSAEAFLALLSKRVPVRDSGPIPASPDEVSMYVDGRWYAITLPASPAGTSHADSLAVAVLQREVLTPLLGIEDIRTDKRIDFVGGARGTGALEAAVNSGRAAVAFSMFPVSVHDLLEVSDAGDIMPPKSTWFEPKLRDGLLIHRI
ncbi:MAG: DUF1015 domain-containing protein [Vicinamibacterales bacterium]|jgi:uncharacterized protein (DUF1015 family)